MRRILLAVIPAVACLFAAPAHAASTQGVVIKNIAYSPKSVTIRVGDSVQWTNQDQTAHTVTADDGSFDTSPGCDINNTTDESCLKPNAPVTLSFDAAGTFNYHCKIHGSAMQATVVVEDPTTTTSSTTTSTTKPTTTTSSSTTTTTSSTTTTTSSTTTSTTTPSSDSGQVAIAQPNGSGGGSSNAPLLLGALVVVAGLAGGAYWYWRRTVPGHDDDGRYWTDEPPPTQQGPRI